MKLPKLPASDVLFRQFIIPFRGSRPSRREWWYMVMHTGRLRRDIPLFEPTLANADKRFWTNGKKFWITFCFGNKDSSFKKATKAYSRATNVGCIARGSNTARSSLVSIETRDRISKMVWNEANYTDCVLCKSRITAMATRSWTQCLWELRCPWGIQCWHFTVKCFQPLVFLPVLKSRCILPTLDFSVHYGVSVSVNRLKSNVTLPPFVSHVLPMIPFNVSGSDLVTIIGTGMIGASQVLIGQALWNTVMVLDDSKLTCRSPPWISANLSIVVIRNGFTSPPAPIFNYQRRIVISNTPLESQGNPGDSVTTRLEMEYGALGTGSLHIRLGRRFIVSMQRC